MKLAIIVAAQLVSTVTAAVARYSSCESASCSPLILSGGIKYDNVLGCSNCFSQEGGIVVTNSNNGFFTHCIKVSMNTSSRPQERYLCVGKSDD